MTQPRNQLVDPIHAGTIHCVNLCVRRAWLCSFDKYLGKSFEHRKSWAEARILELGQTFACGVQLPSVAVGKGVNSLAKGNQVAAQFAERRSRLSIPLSPICKTCEARLSTDAGCARMSTVERSERWQLLHQHAR